ncbi:hypothetical protein C8T65DRAFT_832625 [Cerioporus squamosus]|nr:hypothetical protein C8T65DRAFT_832625 [Cerioporus squamosus]
MPKDPLYDPSDGSPVTTTESGPQDLSTIIADALHLPEEVYCSALELGGKDAEGLLSQSLLPRSSKPISILEGSDHRWIPTFTWEPASPVCDDELLGDESEIVLSSDSTPNIDPAFRDLCLKYRDVDIYGTTTNLSFDPSRLTGKDYPQAYSDFYPSRAAYLQTTWVSILELIIKRLDSLGVRFTSINPFGWGWANERQTDVVCPFLLYIGVIPGSLAFQLAVSAADSVKEILAASNLAEVEVAFVEMINRRSSALGLSIASLRAPHHDGTGALYFCHSSDSNDERIALLTCAHVIRPPPLFPANTGMTRTNVRQAKELMVALGSGGYEAVTAMMAEIAKLIYNLNKEH